MTKPAPAPAEAERCAQWGHDPLCGCKNQPATAPPPSGARTREYQETIAALRAEVERAKEEKAAGIDLALSMRLAPAPEAVVAERDHILSRDCWCKPKVEPARCPEPKCVYPRGHTGTHGIDWSIQWKADPAAAPPPSGHDSEYGWHRRALAAAADYLEGWHRRALAAEARVAETERRMREAGTPYSIEQDKINALVLRVETLEKALLDVQSQAAGHADEFSSNVWHIAAAALEEKP